MMLAPYIALLAALRLAVVMVALVALYGGWLMCADMIWPTDAPEHEK